MNVQQIYEFLEYGSEYNGTSSNLFSEARDKKRLEEIKTSAYWKDMLDDVKKAGEKYLEKKIEVLPYSLFTRFSETGSRHEYDIVFKERRSRLHVLAVLSIFYEEDRYIKELEDVIWAICDEYTWCAPAHTNAKAIVTDSNNQFTTEGRVVRTKRHQKQSIDLLNAMSGFALAEILELLEHKLSPLVVFRARKEITERIIEPFFHINEYIGWEGAEHNWSAVCGGSVGVAAIYLIKDNRILAPILLRMIGAMESFLRSFQEDGFCTEGLGYWDYGFGHYVYFAELLKQRTAGEIDLMSGDKIKEIALFPQRFYLSGDKVISFSDGPSILKYIPVLIHKLKSIFPDVQLPGSTFGRVGNNNYNSWESLIRSFVWSNSEYTVDEMQETSHYFNNAEFITRKKIIDGKVICFVAVAGKNGIHHNHNDVGQFILHVNGETLLTDLGSGLYTGKYFGPERYSVLYTGSQGHSVPVIEGIYQQAGNGCNAEVIDLKQSDERDYFAMDIAKVYKHENLKSLIREFEFEHKDNCKLTLKDSFIFEKQPVSITERFISKHKPVIQIDGKVLVQGEKSSITILYNQQLVKCNVVCEDAVNNLSEIERIYLIDFVFLGDALKESTKVEFTFCIS